MSTLSVTNIQTSNGATDLTISTGNSVNIGMVFSAANGNIGVGTKNPSSHLQVAGHISKRAGTFEIPHPDPAKTGTHVLRHSFVESPTRGDNIYRFRVSTVAKLATVTLPDYWKHLNEDPQVWVSAVTGFGRGYGVLDSGSTQITVTVDTDGDYNVLLIGTRKDEDAVRGFDELGVESIIRK